MMNACEMVERCSQHQVRILTIDPIGNGALRQAPSDVRSLCLHTRLWWIEGAHREILGCQSTLMSIKEDRYELTPVHQHGMQVG